MSKSLARNVALALDMMQSGFDMMRAKLRREHPGEPPAAIEARLMAWRLDRPMDAPGRTMTWESFLRLRDDETR
jgi:hypothetical protein